MTYDTTTDTAEKIIAKWRKITHDYEYGTRSMMEWKHRDPKGTSTEAREWQKARAQVALMQSIMADLADAGIVLPEWPERS